MGHAVATQVYHSLPPRARDALKKLLHADRDAES
jgi:hypothetical protein